MSPSAWTRLVPCLVIAIGLTGGLAAAAVQTTVVHDDGDRIVIEYSFGAYESEAVTIDGEEYLELRFPSEPVSLVAGEPALPHVNRSVIIPDDARMNLRVLQSEYYEIFARIAPSKGNLLRSVDPDDVPYSFGLAYKTAGFRPAEPATLGEPYILRDYRGAVIRVNPFRYDPVTGVLRVYTEMTVELKAEGPGEINVIDHANRSPETSASFQDLYGSHFLNYRSSSRYNAIDEEGGMLIICHDAWIANVAPLVEHKNSIGIPTTVVGVSTIGNNHTSIKNYIQSAYGSGNLAFVLLVGDYAQVDSPIVSGGASDPTYSKLAGSDNYPEILVGRFSASTSAHVDTQVQRTIEYETLPATVQDWFWRGTGIASSEGAGQGDEGQSDFAHQDEIRDWLMGAGYTEVDQIYEPGESVSELINAINAGRGVINYTGHGWSDGWGTTGFSSSGVNGLTNADKLPFIVSVACNNGEFENYASCFGESWLRATHNGAPSGAIGFYGSSILQSWAPPMEGQDEFNLLLTDPAQPYHSYGGLCFAGSSSMMDDYGQDGVEMFNTWNIFGDPSLRVIGSVEPARGLKVGPTSGLVAEGEAGGPFFPLTVDFTLENLETTPIDYAVTSGDPWVGVINGAGTLPPESTTVVTVTVDAAARNLDHGHYAAAVQFVNLTDHEGDTERNVSLTVGLPTLVHEWKFDVWLGDWTFGTLWQFGGPWGLGGAQLGNPDPTGAATGQKVWGVNLKGDYATGIGGPHYLTSGTVDLSQAEGAILRFQRWLNTEGLPTATAFVEISNDGNDWTEVWSNNGDTTDDAWSLQEYDISAVADGQSAVALRWGYGVYSGAVPCSGWNLDDVQILSSPTGSARIDLTVEPADLSWTTVVGATGYDVVGGDLQVLRGTVGDFAAATDDCLASGIGATTVPYSAPLDPGEGRWFLVRGVADTGPMTFQALFPGQLGARDEEIAASGASCP